MKARSRFGKFFSGKKTLITGGLGFIGSNLASRLAELGSDVTLVDSMIPEAGGNLFNVRKIKDRVGINFSDVRDVHSMEFLVRGIDLMFNCAGQVSHIDSMTDPYTDLEVNTRSQLSILEASRKYNPGIKIIFASTRQVYGKPQYLPVDEKHPLNPTDINGINKLAGEWYHVMYHDVYGLKTVCLRMTNTYGPGLLMKHNRQGFIGWFVREIIDGNTVKVYGDGKQLRDLNYIDDVVEALLISAYDDALNGGIFNLGNHPPISLAEIAELLIEINGSGKYKLAPFPSENKKIDIGHYYASFNKFRDATGWEPAVSYRAGFGKMLSYYRRYKKHYWV
ncbi:MAG: NAD-dependent epimerase/dehydratase family protein [Candidatus Omnitrophota bacterium]